MSRQTLLVRRYLVRTDGYVWASHEELSEKGQTITWYARVNSVKYKRENSNQIDVSPTELNVGFFFTVRTHSFRSRSRCVCVRAFPYADATLDAYVARVLCALVPDFTSFLKNLGWITNWTRMCDNCSYIFAYAGFMCVSKMTRQTPSHKNWEDRTVSGNNQHLVPPPSAAPIPHKRTHHIHNLDMEINDNGGYLQKHKQLIRVSWESFWSIFISSPHMCWLPLYFHLPSICSAFFHLSDPKWCFVRSAPFPSRPLSSPGWLWQRLPPPARCVVMRSF